MRDVELKRWWNTQLDPDIVLHSKVGEVGIWIGYRDKMWIGTPDKRGDGRNQLGNSTIAFNGYLERDTSGTWYISDVWGDRYTKAINGWSKWNSDRMTTLQLHRITEVLNPLVASTLRVLDPGVIEAAHARSVARDASNLRDTVTRQRKRLLEEIAIAQASYDRLRAFERDNHLHPTEAQFPLVDHAAIAEHQLKMKELFVDRDMLDGILSEADVLSLYGTRDAPIAIPENVLD